MPKLSPPTQTNRRPLPYGPKSKVPKEKAIRVSTAMFLSLLPGQFTFIRGHLTEYMQHKSDPLQRKAFLESVWHKFLDAYPEQNTPPFPEDTDLVDRFHQARVRALGVKLDNMLLFDAGVRQPKTLKKK